MADRSTPAPDGDLHTRWNFVIIVTEASFFAASLAFIDPAAVLPVLLAKLDASALLIGFMGAIQRAGWLIPQLLVTSFVLHRERKFPFVIYPVLLSRLPLIVLAVLFSTSWGAANPHALLVMTIVIFAAFFFGDGMVGVPWHDICARTIPHTLRGRFFGAMQLAGGILGLAAGELVRRTLADPNLPFPHNYGRLFFFLAAGMMLSTVGVFLIREPRGAATGEAQSLPRIVRSIPSTLRRYPLLRRLIVCQLLSGIPLVAMPFYAVYAIEDLLLPPSVAGRFVQAAILGSAAASMIWAYLSDRRGSSRVLRGVSWTIIGVPLSALLVPPLARLLRAEHAMAYLYALVFLLNGTTWSGIWIGFTNYVLEIAPDDIRPLFLGLLATLASPTVFMPLLGGWLLGFISFQALFALAAAGGLLALVYIYRLREPRHISSPSSPRPGISPSSEESLSQPEARP